MACSEPARGRGFEWSSFSAVRLCTTSHEVSPLFLAVSWLGEEPDPFWERKLRAQIKCIVFCARSSPSQFSSHCDEQAQLRAASKCSFVNVQQSWWGMELTQGGAIKEGVSPNALASRSCCSCEQCAKVPPRISLISVCEMSTTRNLLQCSHAAGPIQLKSAGKNNDSIPASKKQPWGMSRFKLVGSYSALSKLSCWRALHFSKARGLNRACGAS